MSRLHPWSEPRTLREPGGRRVPSFRIGARGIDGRNTAAAAALETREFRQDYRGVHIARRDGDLTVLYPFGSYAMPVHHGAPVVAAPKPGALVAQPGPLLWEVQQQLEAISLAERKAMHGDSLQLLDEGRAAFVDEAAGLVADDQLDFERDEETALASASAPTAAADEPPRDEPLRDPTVAHRHRFDPDPARGFEGVRRVVILRDARRGRPPRLRTRHGADPPA